MYLIFLSVCGTYDAFRDVQRVKSVAFTANLNEPGISNNKKHCMSHQTQTNPSGVQFHFSLCLAPLNRLNPHALFLFLSTTSLTSHFINLTKYEAAKIQEKKTQRPLKMYKSLEYYYREKFY